MDAFFWQSLVVGFLAQLVDGALGMAYGLVSSSFLMAMGMPPAAASAAVHTAEIFSTGASGAAHAWRRNVDWKLVRRLAPAGIVGGIAGAALVSYLPVAIIKPVVSVYLLLVGLFVISLALRRGATTPSAPQQGMRVGLVAGFLDASGGGGWGPITTTTLLGRGQPVRQAVGSVSVSEFFVTAAISATFFFTLGGVRWVDIAGLVLGGLAAAPVAAILVSRVKPRLLMGAIGASVSMIALWQIGHAIQAERAVLSMLSLHP